MKTNRVVLFVAAFSCMSIMMFAQNPHMVGDVNPVSTPPAMSAKRTYLPFSERAVVAGSPAALFYHHDSVLRRLSASGVDELISDPGPVGSIYGLHLLTAVGDRLYYAGPGALTHYFEPWSSDGTPSGTELIWDNTNDASTGSVPTGFTRVGTSGSNAVFFGVTNGATAAQMFYSNGTARGTKVMKKGLGSSCATKYIMFNKNGTVYFWGYDGKKNGIWKTNGTSTGTVFVASIGPMGDCNLPNWYSPLYADQGKSHTYTDNNSPIMVDGLMYFAGTTADGAELWESDGTTAGTRQIANVNPGPASSFPCSFAATPTYLYFQAQNATSGRELFRMHRSTKVVELVADIVPGSSDSEPFYLRALGTKVFFTAYSTKPARQLYVYDEATGVVTLVNINGSGSAFNDLTEYVDNERRHGPFFVPIGSYMYFRAKDDAHGWELWRADGSANAERVTDIMTGPDDTFPTWLTFFNNKLYFRAHDATHGREWWVYDPSQPFSKAVTEEGATTDVSLSACAPNPFSESTMMSYAIGREMPVRLEVVNITGQVIAVLEDAVRTAGVYTITFDGRSHASGVYLCRMTAGGEVRTVPVVLAK